VTGRIILAGAGRFAEEVTSVAADAGCIVAAWIEGLDPGRADSRHRPPILWVDEQAGFEPDLPVVVAIGSVKRRGLIERLVREGRTLDSLVHPSAVVARSAILAAGVVVFPLVVIGARAEVGMGTILNRGALVGHHTSIGAHAFVGPGAVVAGGVTIGDSVQIGMGALVRDDVRVGEGAIVGMGAVVLGNVGPGTTVVGNPARPTPAP
jgi:acetyltransferase EpsM